MLDDPEEQRVEHAADPRVRAEEKASEIRIYAEMYAVFEGVRKFDASIRHDIPPSLAKSVQQDMLRMRKSRVPEHPILPIDQIERATAVLMLPSTQPLLSTNDYFVFVPEVDSSAENAEDGQHVHVSELPSQILIFRWLADEQVEQFYERLQAHFDAGIQGCREDERASLGWKADRSTKAYLDALDVIHISMADRYLRGILQSSGFRALSTQTAGELNVSFLSEQVMGVPMVELFGEGRVPEDPDPAMYYELFALRGSVDSTEHMCFLAFLQAPDEW